MGNFDTVTSITENMQRALMAEGVRFPLKTFEDERSIPASLFPFGELFYAGEAFEQTHGERPGYVEAAFLVKVVLNAVDPAGAVRSQQDWVHRVRGALTTEALNTGGLSSARPVSRVTVDRAEVDNTGSTSSVTLRVEVRYRES